MMHVDFLLSEGSLAGAVWSAIDVLRELNTQARSRAPRRQAAAAASWRLIDANGRTHRMHALTCQTDNERRNARWPAPGPRVLLVPPLAVQSLHALQRQTAHNRTARDLARRRFEAGDLLAACGTGLWVLANAGVLSRAPVPWLYQSGFEKHFPQIQVEPQAAIVTSDQVVGAAAPSLMHALVLRVAAYAGLADLAHAASEILLLNTERQELATLMTSDEIMRRSRDAPLYRAQSWIQAHAGEPLRVEDAAAAAAVSTRTLNRLFQHHLGQTPQQYLQAVRVKRAQMWLEGTWRGVDEIARDCGYTDSSAFSRMFSRAVGLSPRRYRERFTFRGARALWRAGEEADLPGSGQSQSSHPSSYDGYPGL